MGFYSRCIFPLLCDWALDQPFVAQRRRDLLSSVAGEILEIGFGTGLNLPHYREHVRNLTIVDPNAGMHWRAQRRIAQSQFPVDRHVASGQQLPFPDARFDCVVSTLTLCSIDAASDALAEIFRVIRPGGRFLFLEHGLSSDPSIQKWQRRLNWLQRRLGDGCRLDRDMKALISSQPFENVECTEFYMEHTPKTHGYMYQGTATKS